MQLIMTEVVRGEPDLLSPEDIYHLLISDRLSLRLPRGPFRSVDKSYGILTASIDVYRGTTPRSGDDPDEFEILQAQLKLSSMRKPISIRRLLSPKQLDELTQLLYNLHQEELWVGDYT